MKKRILSAALSLMMVTGLIVTNMPNNVKAQNDELSLSKETVYQLDRFEVTLSVPPIEEKADTVEIHIGFDKNSFEVVEWEPAKFNGSNNLTSSPLDGANRAGECTVSSSNDTACIDLTEGYTATATFEVKADAELGEYIFSLDETFISYFDENELDDVNIYEPTDVKAQVTIAVRPVAATAVNLDKTECSLKAGDISELTASILPGNSTDTLTWISSNSDIVKVTSEDGNKGKLEAVSVGMAVITAKAGDVFATCNVTVTCNHSLITIEAIAEDCGNDGLKAYYECSKCHKLYVDEEANTETTVELQKIPATGNHRGGSATCTEKAVCEVCNKTYGEFASHKFTIAEHNGTQHWNKCSECDATDVKTNHTPDEWNYDNEQHWSDCTKEGCGLIASSKGDHTGGSATCTEQAVCEVCNIPYGEKAKHSFTVAKYDSERHWNKCANCNETEGMQLHTFDIEVKTDKTLCKAATCTDDAEYYYSCECGAIGTEIFTVEGTATGHLDTEIKNKVNASEDKEGYTGDVCCKECGEVLTSGEVIPAIKIVVVDMTDDAISEKLLDAGFDTVEKIKEELIDKATAQNGYDKENTSLYDVVAKFQINGEWVDVTEDNYPEGMKVQAIIPYPEGTNATEYNFVVAHMFASEVNGKTVGDVELPEIVKKDEGIYVELNGLSPIVISWKKIEIETTPEEGTNAGLGTENATSSANNNTETEATTKPVANAGTGATPGTGDVSRSVLWMSLMIAAGFGVVLSYRKKAEQ